MEAFRQPHLLEQLAGVAPGVSLTFELERQQDIFESGQVAQQPERLEDEADVIATQSSKRVLGEILDLDVVEQDATRCWSVESGEKC